MIEEINKEIQRCPETIFDTFDLTINLKMSGAALREELIKLANLYGRINQLSSNAIFKLEQSRNRLGTVISIAWAKYGEEFPSVKPNTKKILVKEYEVIVDGNPTSINKEEANVLVYEYISQRGKDKAKEISSILDVGRTLLSWDKAEYGRSNS